MRIDVGTSLRLPSLNNSPAAAVGPDYLQHDTTSDASSASTAEAVTCNGSEIKVDVTNDAQSSDESGGMLVVSRYIVSHTHTLDCTVGTTDRLGMADGPIWWPKPPGRPTGSPAPYWNLERRIASCHR